MTGTEEELDKLITFLKTKYKVAIEEGPKLSFLKRDTEFFFINAPTGTWPGRGSVPTLPADQGGFEPPRRLSAD